MAVWTSMGGEDMKDNKLEVGTLCTIREDSNECVPEEDRGYWVVLAFSDCDRYGVDRWVKAFSLTHQRDCWRDPNDLIPVVRSGV
jgi:hypothetical protein